MPPKVLVVEDSRFYLQMITAGLTERLGFEVLPAQSLAEAREILSARAGDILVALLDINLPDAPDGEVVDEVARHHIPSIVFTGSFSEKTREFVLARHVVDYVTKDGPGNVEMVFDLVRRVVQNTACRILVADGDAASRRRIAGLLRLHRFPMSEASDADAALAALEAEPGFRLAIIDQDLPETDGVELTRRIRSSFGRNDLAVIGLSPAGRNVVSARFMKAGANDYLNKPFVPEEFFCRVYHNLDLIEQINSLRQAKQEVQQASESKTRFLGHLNHEIGTPLNAIIGFSDLALDHKAGMSGEVAHYVTSIRNGGLHLKALVSDALDVARIESGRLDLTDDEVNLGQLCLEVVAFLQPLSDAGGQTVQGEFLPTGPVVRADRRRLKQVMLNLMSNAIKFTPEDGEVAIGAGVGGDGRPYLVVRDSGCGMSEDGIKTALSPFGQLGDRESRSKGTGLGLPLSKSLIEGHGGMLLIDSRPGNGTRMTVLLPRERLLGA
jgi:Signal transduction histidine kinase